MYIDMNNVRKLAKTADGIEHWAVLEPKHIYITLEHVKVADLWYGANGSLDFPSFWSVEDLMQCADMANHLWKLPIVITYRYPNGTGGNEDGAHRIYAHFISGLYTMPVLVFHLHAEN